MLSVRNQVDFSTRAARVSEKVARSAEKLSSGLRINRASDDAGGLAISEKLRTQVRGLNQALRNIQHGINLVKIGEDGVGSTRETLQRLRELVLQAANGTNSQESLDAIDVELTQIKKLTIDAFNVAFFFRQTFDGVPFDRKLDFQVGADQGQEITVDYNPLRTTMLNFIIRAFGYTELYNDPAAFGVMTSQFGGPLPPPNSPAPPPFFPATFDQAFPKLLKISPNDAATIATSLQVIDDGLRGLISQEAYLGAAHNRLEHALATVELGIENMAAAESRIRDVDVAHEMSNMTRHQIMQRPAQAMIVQSAAKQRALVELIRGRLGPTGAAA